MSVGRRVYEAIEKAQIGDSEGALIPISIAIDATSAKVYGKQGRSAYKRFIRDEFNVITRVAFVDAMLGQMNVAFDHPDVKKESNGLCSVVEILYHVVRCGLIHSAGLPPNIQFAGQNAIHVNDNSLILPASLIYGLIMAVVVSPVNAAESLPAPCVLNLRGRGHELAGLWGKRVELMTLYESPQP